MNKSDHFLKPYTNEKLTQCCKLFQLVIRYKQPEGHIANVESLMYICVQCLCQFVLDTPYEGLQEGSLRVLGILAHSIAVSKFSTLPGQFIHGCITGTGSCG